MVSRDIRRVAAGRPRFRGEQDTLENPVSMVRQSVRSRWVEDVESLIMIGVVLLLVDPFVRVRLRRLRFAAQRTVYATISLLAGPFSSLASFGDGAPGRARAKN